MDEQTREQIVSYALDELSPQDRARVEAMLPADDQARGLLARLRTTIATMKGDDTEDPPQELTHRIKAIFGSANAPTSSWIDAAANLVASLVFDSRKPGALAGFRGGEGGLDYHLFYERGQMSVDLQVSPSSGPKESWTIRGQVDRPDEDDRPVSVALLDEQRQPVKEAAIDASGSFRMDVNRGSYQLAVRIGDAGVLLPMVDVE
jgi:hypothetical protein